MRRAEAVLLSVELHKHRLAQLALFAREGRRAYPKQHHDFGPADSVMRSATRALAVKQDTHDADRQMEAGVSSAVSPRPPDPLSSSCRK